MVLLSTSLSRGSPCTAHLYPDRRSGVGSVSVNRHPLPKARLVNRNVDAVLRYWRTSLADGALGEGKFSQRDRQRFIELSSETLRNGLLPKESINRLFKDQPKAKIVGVRFWPLVVARRLSHGAASGDGLPELVAPVVTEALVDREGRISP